jgi:hypothetical protein
MTLQEIKNAVNQGKDVFWKHDGYKVVAGIEKAVGKYFVVCTANSHTIGLTWRDGKTMNGAEEDFYLGNDNF